MKETDQEKKFISIDIRRSICGKPVTMIYGKLLDEIGFKEAAKKILDEFILWVGVAVDIPNKGNTILLCDDIGDSVKEYIMEEWRVKEESFLIDRLYY